MTPCSETKKPVPMIDGNGCSCVWNFWTMATTQFSRSRAALVKFISFPSASPALGSSSTVRWRTSARVVKYKLASDHDVDEHRRGDARKSEVAQGCQYPGHWHYSFSSGFTS